MTTPIRAAFLTVMPTPYWQDLFAAFRHDGRVVPLALYMQLAAPGTHWGNRPLPNGETVLPSRFTRLLGGRASCHPSVGRFLRDARADVYVVGGYSTPTTQAAMRWLVRNGKPWVFFGERPGVSRRGRLGEAFRRLAMSPVVRGADAVAAVGSSAVAAYERFGFDGRPVANIPYFTDTRPFRDRPAAPGRTPGRFRILYCGQLIARKGVDVLLAAFAQVARRHREAELILAGEGPLREKFRASVPSELRERVRFIGFQPVDRLPGLFSEADLFVLPSRHDGWGVVVNQALAAGLPVVATDAVGAAQDFVDGRGTGAVVAAGECAPLAEAILRFAEDNEELRRCAARASTVASELTLERGVEAWTTLFQNVLSTRRGDRSVPPADERPERIARNRGREA